MPRFAMAGFQHETNSFAPGLTGMAAFEMADSWPGMLTGQDVISCTRGMNLPIAGFAAAAEAAGATPVPVLWCAAEPGGHVADAAFEEIAGRIVTGIVAAGPLDGIYLDLHGAMVTEGLDDGEGALLARLRDAVGPDIPIVLSLDLHANLSRACVDLADVICIYRTYPHLDMSETGARAYGRLMQRMDGVRFAKAFRQSDFEIPLHAQHTHGDPARGLYTALPDRDTALVEMSLGFTAARSPDRVPAVVAYAPNPARADTLAAEALARLTEARDSFDRSLMSAPQAVAAAMASPGPVVLADVQDNPGAGASSDTTGLLRALVAARAHGAIMGLFHDPALAARAHGSGAGTEIDGTLGGRSCLPDDAPFPARFRVDALSDGLCAYSGEMYAGGIATLGPSAALSLRDIGADIRVVVTSIRNQCLDLAHFTHFGLDPAEAQIVCVKSTTHFRAAFAPIATRIIPVAAPGLFPCT